MNVEMVDISFSIPREFLSNLNHSEENQRIFFQFMKEILERVSSIQNSKNLKKTFYHSPSMITNTDCAICLEEIRLFSSIHIFPCRHGFHVHCTKSLTDNHHYTCPVCRTPL